MESYGLNKDGTAGTMYGTAPDYYISQDVSEYIQGRKTSFSCKSIKQIMLYDIQLKYTVNKLIK